MPLAEDNASVIHDKVTAMSAESSPEIGGRSVEAIREMEENARVLSVPCFIFQLFHKSIKIYYGLYYWQSERFYRSASMT